MPRPFVNLDDIEFSDIEDNGYYASRRAQFSAGIGARKLGYNLTVLPPGKAQCPFHSQPVSIPTRTRSSSARANRAPRASGRCSGRRRTSITMIARASSLPSVAPDPSRARSANGGPPDPVRPRRAPNDDFDVRFACLTPDRHPQATRKRP